MSLGAARVIYSINDLSLYIDNILAGYVIYVGEFERGPIYTPVPVTTQDEMERWFGRTYDGSLDPLIVKSGLMQGAKFLIIRIVNLGDQADVTSMTSVAATATLTDQGDSPMAAEMTSDEGPWLIKAPAPGSMYGRASENYTFGYQVSDLFKFQAGAKTAVEFSLTGVNQSAQDVADQINAADTENTIVASAYRPAVGVADVVKITAVAVGDSVKILATSTPGHSAYGILGFDIGTYQAQLGNNVFSVAIHGQATQNFTLTSGLRNSTQITQDLSTLLGGRVRIDGAKFKIITIETGVSATVQATSSIGRTELGFNATVFSGSAAGTPQPTLKITAKDPGAWGNSVLVQTFANRIDPTKFDVRVVYIQQPSLNEFFTGVTMDSTSDRYVVNFINGRSLLITVEDKASATEFPLNMPAFDSVGVQLLTGDDGDPVDTQDWIGDPLAQTGMYAARKTDESIDIMIASTSDAVVIQTLVGLAEDEGLIAYAMVPEDFDPEDALSWRNGEDIYTFEKFNNCHLFLEYGRPDFYDSRMDQTVSIPNLGMFASRITQNDVLYDYSHAPVGPRRGTVNFVEGLDWNLDTYPGYQDEFADNQINYLEMTKSEGAVFWEQQTALIANSSMQQLNVMRFLLVMKRMFMPVLRTFIEEPNHPVTWGEVHRVLEPQLMLWKSQRMIYSYYLQTDRDAFFDDSGELKNAVLNTGQEIQQGIYHARVLIQPTLAIRYFEFEVGVLATGTPYVNYSTMHTLPGWVRR